jgi:3-hydroxybutyryl-CoA dehydrogenase
LLSGIIELAATRENQEAVDKIFRGLDWEYLLVPDIVGMITPRVIAMIINEAYFALHDGVSSEEEIDIAMRLGTNYPYGPFEWSRKIGIAKVYDLLMQLSQIDQRYSPAPLLRNEIKQ